MLLKKNVLSPFINNLKTIKMKKLFIYGLSFAVVAGSVSSCKKSSKGKVSNDWSVTGYEFSEKDAGTNYTSNTTKTLSGSSLKITGSFTSGGTTTPDEPITQSIQDWSYVINKDGTWSRTKNYTVVTEKELVNASFTTVKYNETEVHKTTEGGNWNFVGKNKTEEFKKNERIAFNTLSYEGSTATSNDYSGTTPTVPTVSTVTVTDTWSGTIEVGTSLEVYTIVESKKKSLTLKMNNNSTSNSNYGTASANTITSETTITLTQK